MTKFKIDDKVTAIRFIKFCDGSCHDIGRVLVITEETLSYFIVNSSDYRLVS